MNQNINQYLAKVFRNEAHDVNQSADVQVKYAPMKAVEDQIARKFLIEKKYSLGLDEII